MLGNKVLIVDPGTPFGFALWKDGDALPVKTGQRIQPGCKSWEEKSAMAADQLDTLITTLLPGTVYCERPKYMSGHAAAAGGNLVKLCFTFGRFMQVAYHHRVPFYGVDPGWLGQLDAKAIRHRAEGVIGSEFTDALGEHALDAVCIGLHLQGRWPRG